jgi:hypothetical protein
MICRGLGGAGRPVLGCPGRAARETAAPRAAQGAFGAPAAPWDTRRPQNALGAAATLGLTASWRPSTGPIRR